MRGAENIKEVSLTVNGKSGKIHSFWITENKTVYVKVQHGSTYTNYRLNELPNEFQVVKKVHFDDEE